MAMEKLMASFSRRISDLEELMLLRGADSRMAALDASLKAVEHEICSMDRYVKSEMEALGKAKMVKQLASQQSKKLRAMMEYLPSAVPAAPVPVVPTIQVPVSTTNRVSSVKSGNTSPVHAQAPKEKKGKVPPRRYVNEEEFASLSSYMRGRITLDKVNSAVDEMAGFADANTRLILAPRKKLGDDILDKVLELRDISVAEPVKGKHFFLESDMRGPLLKLDTTGKAIITILRHLGRVLEMRIGKHRVFALTNG